MSHAGRGLVAGFTAAAIVGFARVMTGVRATWHGAPPCEAPTVYFANHTSHGDFVLVWAALPAVLRRRTRPVAACDYWSASPLRRFIGQDVFGALLIDRAPPPGARGADPVQAMAEAAAAGDSLILFPEGTRNTTEAPLLPLRSGLFHLAQACPDLRLVPVWIENLRRVLPKGAVVPVPLACSVDFGAPLTRVAGEDKATFLARAAQALLDLRPETQETEAMHTATPPMRR